MAGETENAVKCRE